MSNLENLKNFVILEGYLTKDAFSKEIVDKNGDKSNFVAFTIACNVSRNKAIFLDCVKFDFPKEDIAKLLKGSLVRVNGSIGEREYKDKNGMTRKVIQIKVNKYEIKTIKKGVVKEDSDDDDLPF